MELEKAPRSEPVEVQHWLGSPKPPGTAIVAPVSIARWLLVLVIGLGVYFFYGFIVPVLGALVISFASWPLFQMLKARVKGNRTVAASLSVLLILIFVIVPVFLASSYALREIGRWLRWTVEANRTGARTPGWVANLPFVGDWANEEWTRLFAHPGGIGELIQIVTGSNIGAIYHLVFSAGAGVFNFLLTLLFMMIVLFCVYRDGSSLAAQIDKLGERILPRRWERFSRIVPETVSATVTGMTLIAVGEGIVLGLAYWVAGAPSPITLGVLTGIMALVPGGAPLSFTLVSLYLLGTGSPIAALSLFVWGTTELFIVDKTLRPRVVGGPIKLPFLPTFFGLIGGVKTMGLLGLFIGPVLMALLVAIWREWLREVDTQEANNR
ncbi:putative PurR-regulated permease PerM [Rhizobium aquaticum]|uniref:PurR-regulated permease PerM n=1 Tax=Rhizobium aquaticum TaxID=1549636 RepID=A0ABV2IUA3_9HYPH